MPKARVTWTRSHLGVITSPSRNLVGAANAAPQPLPEAGATEERMLEAVGCRRLFGAD